jgi:hypothetical protein
MAETPLLAVRCPQDLIDLIERERDLTGRSKTDVVIERLKQSIPSLPVVDRGNLPPIPAVYLVFTSDNRLLYIGQTRNLNQRWMTHRRYSQFVETDVNSRVAWFAFDPDSIESLPSVESELITALDSEYNGTPVKGNRAVTCYLPRDLEESLTRYCTENGITRKDKTGENRPALGTGIVEALKIFFSNDTLPSPIPSTVPLPDNVVTVDRLETAIDSLRSEFQPALELAGK